MIMSLKQRKIKFKPRKKLNHNVYLGNEIVSWRLLQRLAKVVMDGHFVFKQFNAIPAKSPKKLLWLVLPVKICLMSSSQFYRSIFAYG